MGFPTFFHFAAKLVDLTGQGPEGRGEEPEGPGQPPGQQPQQAADRRAQEEEVDQPPQEEPRCHVQPDVAVPQGQGAGQETAQGQGPEGQVQQGGGPPGEGGEPELPQQVVDQAQQSPGCQTQDQGVALGGGGEAHPRRRRERKETGSSGSS